MLRSDLLVGEFPELLDRVQDEGFVYQDGGEPLGSIDEVGGLTRLTSDYWRWQKASGMPSVKQYMHFKGGIEAEPTITPVGSPEEAPDSISTAMEFAARRTGAFATNQLGLDVDSILAYTYFGSPERGAIFHIDEDIESIRDNTSGDFFGFQIRKRRGQTELPTPTLRTIMVIGDYGTEMVQGNFTYEEFGQSLRAPDLPTRWQKSTVTRSPGELVAFNGWTQLHRAHLDAQAERGLILVDAKLSTPSDN